MGVSEVTLRALECEDCALGPVKPSDPKRVLERLPLRVGTRGLFNPAVPESVFRGSKWDDIYVDEAVFGLLPPGVEPTLQYELARILSAERDLFAHEMRHATALTLAVGRMRVEDNRVRTECPRATGPDLDALGAQYGIGRPPGFTDCCYWRLVLLLLFNFGSPLWRLREIAALYTGTRPEAAEYPDRVILIWPGAEDTESFYNDAFMGDGHWLGDAPGPLQPPDEFDGFWSDGASTDGESFWDAEGGAPVGLRLIDALNIAKPAGVAVILQNPPPLGMLGCYGATKRGAVISHPGEWA